jgi:type IV pilus biogenesis protein PilP
MFNTNLVMLVLRPVFVVLAALSAGVVCTLSATGNASAATTGVPTDAVASEVAVQPIDAAAATGTNENSGTIGEVGRLQTQTVLQTARLNLKKVNDELEPAAGREGANSSAPVAQAAADALPNVRMIINDTASFVFSDGSRATATVGGTLPGGWKVIEVSGQKRSVRVADRKGRVYQLAISSQAPQAPVDQSTANRMGQNGMPMMGGPVGPMGTSFGQKR